MLNNFKALIINNYSYILNKFSKQNYIYYIINYGRNKRQRHRFIFL